MVNVVVSACLLGEPCRYDGKSQPSSAVRVLEQIEGIRLVPICPEVQGGLAIPRPSAEIQPGENLCVMNVAGQDVTQPFVDGAHLAMTDAIKTNSWVAVLKAKSPSCGSGQIYDGSFTGTLTKGWGITADLFDRYGMIVLDENQLMAKLSGIKAKTQEDWNVQVREMLEGLEKQASENAQKANLEPETNTDEPEEEMVAEMASQEQIVLSGDLPPVTLKNFWGHLRTITKHKVEVAKLCFKIGLVWQGIKHDLSKYSPTEFMLGVRFYQGFRSPNAAERECRGYTEAWLHHKGRNKHHFEYWLDLSDDVNARLKPAPMPTKYILEMLCDRIAASKTYKGDAYTDQDPWNYFDRSRGYVIMHPETSEVLERLLRCLAEEGEPAVIEMAKQLYTESKSQK